MAAKLLQHGIAVFCPWTDHQLFLQLREGEVIDLETIRAHSVEWMKVSDAVLALKGWAQSKGTMKELTLALDLGLPVFYSTPDLITWACAK